MLDYAQAELEDSVDKQRIRKVLGVAWGIALLSIMALLITILIRIDRADLAAAVAAKPTSMAWTIGNNSYIPVEPLPYGFNTDKSWIMRLEAEFERTHPDLRVLSYSLDLLVHEQYTQTDLQGIWVHHEPNK